jgi:hypothetical protein
MVLVALAVVVSLAAGLSTFTKTEVSADEAADRWYGFTLPSEVGYQLFPGTDVGPIALAADGTLFAAVYDHTFNRWGSPAGTVFAAVLYSTDGGYTWHWGWELPEDDPGPVVDVVAAPGYAHPGTVYFATMTYVYYSTNGGSSFYRMSSVCPGVVGDPDSGVPGGIITSLDVAVDAVAPGEYVAVVGTDRGGLDGVYTWNIGGLSQWRDMEIGNRVAAAWDTGGEGALEVAFSPSYPADRLIYAVANYDPCIISPPWTGSTGFTTVVSVYDGFSGTWGIEYMDAALPPGNSCAYARLAFFDDFDIAGSPYCIVGISGSGVDDVYRVKTLPPATGPSAPTALGLGLTPIYSVDAYGTSAADATILAGVASAGGSGQAQVFIGTGPLAFPDWEPAMKPPSGGAGLGLLWGGVYVVTDGASHYVATGENWGMSASGVSRGIINSEGKWVWNGVGLIDTIVVTTDILGWTNYAAVVFEEVSPAYATGSPGDDTLYITTWSAGCEDAFVFGDIAFIIGDGYNYGFSGRWVGALNADGNINGRLWATYGAGGVFCLASGTVEGEVGVTVTVDICCGDPIGKCYTASGSISGDGTVTGSFSGGGVSGGTIQGTLYAHAGGLSLWRHAPTGSVVWERIACENMVLPQAGALLHGVPATVSAELLDLSDMGGSLVGFDTTFVPRVAPGFEQSNHMFMLAGMGSRDQLLYSFDRGDTWKCTSTMPGTAGAALSDTGWTVVDDGTVIMGDTMGYVYKTVNCGNSWTDGVDTATGLVTDLNVSPIYSEAGGQGTDQVVVVGLYNYNASAGQVWLSQDGAEEQFIQVGRDIIDDIYGLPSKVVTNFDPGWGEGSSPANRFIYAGVSGFLARHCCGCEAPASLSEHGETGIYRSQVDVDNPSDSYWELIYGLEDIEPYLPDAASGQWRYWAFTDLEYGHEGTVYVPFGVLQWVDPDECASAVQFRIDFALGGALRTFDGATEYAADVAWNVLTLGLPRAPACGLWLLRAVPGTNHLFSIIYQLDVIGDEVADYDLGLVTFEDTLCGAGPLLVSPADGATGVGDPVGELEKVNVRLDWEAVDSTATVTYQWQVDGDSGFTEPVIAEGFTTETFAQVVNLESGFKYFWRVRVSDPNRSAWSQTYSFVTVGTTNPGVMTAPRLISPTAGATGVPLRPAFSWTVFTGMTSYRIQVAGDTGFADIVIDAVVDATAYQPDADLDVNTTYYWRVMGLSDAEETDWSSTGVFTTGPVAAPGIAVWVWVLIGIGAVFVVGVVVLIMMTKKPV